MQILENIYQEQNSQRRGNSFSILGKIRGDILRKEIGTGKRILDLGCRDGYLTGYYREGNDILGADIDEQALNIAKSKLSIETKKVDLNGQWEFLEGFYDVVVAAEILEHLYFPEKVLKKIKQVLKDDGRLLGSVPNAFSLANRFRLLFGKKRGTTLYDKTHINHFSSQELQKILRSQFTEIKFIPLGRFAFLDRIFPGLFSYMIFFIAKQKK